MTLVGRLEAMSDGRPIHVRADEAGIEVHVTQPLRSARSIRGTVRALGEHRALRDAIDGIVASPTPVSVRLGSLPPVRLHPDPGLAGRWLRRRL